MLIVNGDGGYWNTKAMSSYPSGRPLHMSSQVTYGLFLQSLLRAIPIKCFVSRRPPCREGGPVGRAKKKKKEWTDNQMVKDVY